MIEKCLIRDKEYSTEFANLSEKHPIKFIYKNVSNPIFTVKATEFSLSTHKPYAMLSLKKFDPSFMNFLENLDQKIPQIAYQRRKEWFSSDLFGLDEERFNENYKKNISDYGFSIYLGLLNGNDLPVMSFIQDDNTSSPRPMNEALQELAWGFLNGNLIILMQITGLWIKEESYGLSWKVLQLLYRKKSVLPKGCQIISLDKIKNHNWIPPPEEEDVVELPDDVEPSNIVPIPPINIQELQAEQSDQSEQSEQSEQSGQSDQSDQSGPLKTKEMLPEIKRETDVKPYNPLMETDD